MCKVTINSNSDPYILDKISESNIPALTQKNAKFIEAVVNLDSNYGMDADINSEPQTGFDPFNEDEANLKKYCGSSAYWFNQMKTKADYKKCLMGAIIAIDRTNATHLEATENGRKKMYEIIFKKADNVDALEYELNKDFNTDSENHLIGLMSVDLIANGREGTRSNLSFASKFCSYASAALGCEKNYSKYDAVVSNHLCDYINAYLNINTKKSEIQYNSQKKKKCETEPAKLDYVLSVYRNYSQRIEEIIKTLRKDYQTIITKDELDHIIWYGFKGRNS